MEFSLVNASNGWDLSNFYFRTDTLFIDSNRLFFHMGNVGFTPNARLITNIDNVVGFRLSNVDESRNILFGAYYKNSLLHPTSLLMGGWYEAYNAKFYYKLSTQDIFSSEIGMYKRFGNKNFNLDYIAFLNPTVDTTAFVSPGTGFRVGYYNNFITIGAISKIYAWRYRFLYNYYPEGLFFLSLYYNIRSRSGYFLGGGINLNRDFSNFITYSTYVSQNVKLNNRSYLSTSLIHYANRSSSEGHGFDEYDWANHIVYNFKYLNCSFDASSSFINSYFKNMLGVSFFANYERIFAKYYAGYSDDHSPVLGQRGFENRFYLSWNYMNYGIYAEFNTINRSLAKVYAGVKIGHGITDMEAGYTWNNAYSSFNINFRTGGEVEKISANTLKGKIYFDKNDNKIFDKGDTGVKGVNIYIDGIMRCKSGDNGDYRIYFIPSGKHRISLGMGTMPAFIGAEKSSTEIAMPRFGKLIFNIPFYKLSSIEGRVFYDDNGNGFYDKGEKGVPNVLIEAGGKWTLTDDEGFYTLANLLPGQYIVKPKLLPEGYHLTIYNLKMILFLKQGDNAKNIDFGITKKSKNIIMKEF